MHKILNIYSFRKSRHKSESIQSEKNVLIVGAGRVAAPLVEYLYRDKSVGITVACEQMELADGLVREFPGIESAYINASEESSTLQVNKSDNIAADDSMLDETLFLGVSKKL